MLNWRIEMLLMSLLGVFIVLWYDLHLSVEFYWFVIAIETLFFIVSFTYSFVIKPEKLIKDYNDTNDTLSFFNEYKEDYKLFLNICNCALWSQILTIACTLTSLYLWECDPMIVMGFILSVCLMFKIVYIVIYFKEL